MMNSCIEASSLNKILIIIISLLLRGNNPFLKSECRFVCYTINTFVHNHACCSTKWCDLKYLGQQKNFCIPGDIQSVPDRKFVILEIQDFNIDRIFSKWFDRNIAIKTVYKQNELLYLFNTFVSFFFSFF
jgi:hypothetical protein